MNIEKFNIRVYGLLFNDKKEVLLCDEEMTGHRFTKFPGGGLEYGEGLHDALKREWMEELKTAIDIVRHIYTTDFFQASAFHHAQQLISIYYEVKLLQPLAIPISDIPFQFLPDSKEKICFRWAALETSLIEQLNFPIDKRVASMLTS
jgi:ADP-ribose pyrophosphatase YjhB (NUDIX family)